MLDLLPKPLPPLQDVPGPQIALLRRRTVPVLRHHTRRRVWRALRGVFQQGEALPEGLQFKLYHDAPGETTPGVGEFLN